MWTQHKFGYLCANKHIQCSSLTITFLYFDSTLFSWIFPHHDLPTFEAPYIYRELKNVMWLIKYGLSCYVCLGLLVWMRGVDSTLNWSSFVFRFGQMESAVSVVMDRNTSISLFYFRLNQYRDFGWSQILKKLEFLVPTWYIHVFKSPFKVTFVILSWE